MRISVMMISGALALGACTEFPDLGPYEDRYQGASYPGFAPIQTVPETAPAQHGIEARVARLRARAANLRQRRIQ